MKNEQRILEIQELLYLLEKTEKERGGLYTFEKEHKEILEKELLELTWGEQVS